MKVQIAGHTLSSIGSVSASPADAVQEATSFMAACNGETKSSNELCASDGGEMIQWQSEYCFLSKASVTLQEVNPFGSMQQNDPKFKHTFGDTRMSLAGRCLTHLSMDGCGIPWTKY